MNPLDELASLTRQFPSKEPLIVKADHIAASQTPDPYKRLLAHDYHMTITLEDYHRSSVRVNVLKSHLDGDVYCRKIMLYRCDTGAPVLFGLVKFNLQFVTQAVRQELIAEQIPLGRVLITHNVLRQVDLGAILEITPGAELRTLLQMPEEKLTYGRLATIFCNRAPAVDLLEVIPPLT